MFGAYPFGEGYFGQGPALTPDVVLPTIVDGPIHIANLQAKRPEAYGPRAKRPTPTNWEQH